MLLRPLEHTDFLRHENLYLDCSKQYRRIVHQTLSNMFNSIIDLIEKPPTNHISSYQSTMQRNTLDENIHNIKTMEQSDRFRKFLHLSLDYIYLFHHECSLFENFTLRLLDICLIGFAYLIEKRSNSITSRHQMSLILFRCGDSIKQIAQKLVTIALDPDNQSLMFRIKVLKHIIDQPNSKAILEFLFNNDTQCYLYHQILIYLQILSNATPSEFEFEHIKFQFQNSLEQQRKPFDSEHPKMVHRSQIFSNGEESSHTINILSKQPKTLIKHPVQVKIPDEKPSTEEEQNPNKQSNPSTSNDEKETTFQKIHERSLSPAPSMASLCSELTIQQSSITNYQNIINTFRDLMRTINIQSLTANDSNGVQRRALTEYLLTPSSTRKNTRNLSSIKYNPYVLFSSSINPFQFSNHLQT